MQVLVVLPPTLNGGVTKPVGADVVGAPVQPSSTTPHAVDSHRVPTKAPLRMPSGGDWPL